MINKILITILLLAASVAMGDTIFFDSSLVSDCVGKTYSIANCNCTGTGTYKAYKSPQTALDTAVVGDKIYGRTATYYSTSVEDSMFTITKSGTSWSAGQYFYIGKWPSDSGMVILDGQDKIKPGSQYGVLGSLVEKNYWQIEWLEIRNGGYYDGSGAHGLVLDNGPLIMKYCYIHNNQSSSVNGLPSGFSSHRLNRSLIEYCYFKDNGASIGGHWNASHVEIFGDYDQYQHGQYGFDWEYDDAEHAYKNCFRYNLVEGGSSGMYYTKSTQRFGGFNTAGGIPHDMAYKNYGDTIHHNIYRGINYSAVTATMDFLQIYNNIIDSCVYGIFITYGQPTAYKICIYNNTLKKISKGAICAQQLKMGDSVYSVDSQSYHYVINNLIDSAGYSLSDSKDLITSVYESNWPNALQDSFIIDRTYYHSVDTPKVVLLGADMYTTSEFISLRPSALLWDNNNSGLWLGDTGKNKYIPANNFVIDGSTTVNNAGIGGTHPYLSHNMPSYIGATTPGESNGWVDSVNSLSTINVNGWAFPQSIFYNGRYSTVYTVVSDGDSLRVPVKNKSSTLRLKCLLYNKGGTIVDSSIIDASGNDTLSGMANNVGIVKLITWRLNE